MDPLHAPGKPGSHGFDVRAGVRWLDKAVVTEALPRVPDSRDVLSPIRLIEVHESRHGIVLREP